MTDAYVRGVGFWSPGFPSAAAWCSGRPEDGAARPGAALLAGPLGRRATGLTRLGVEALQQAASDAKVDVSSVATVWATAHGEHETAVEILRGLVLGDGRVSPTKFHNSVYNTAAGYASIATGNRQPSTTLSGGADLVAMALLEGLCTLSAGARNVIVVVLDEPMLPPFDARGATAPMAAAFCISSEPGGARVRLAGLRREGATRVPRHPRFGGLYVSAALPLLEAVVLGRTTRVALELDTGEAQPAWTIGVSTVGRAAGESHRA